MVDWTKYPNFTEAEMKCKYTGECEMDEKFMGILQAIRNDYGKPMRVTSGFRGAKHPIEAAKREPGEHNDGTCADVACSGPDAFLLMKIAIKHGITRIGVSQKGPPSSRYLHLGIGGNGLPNPAVWSY